MDRIHCALWVDRFTMHCGRQDLSQKKKKTAIRFLILSFFSSSFLCLFDGVVGGGRWFVCD